VFAALSSTTVLALAALQHLPAFYVDDGVIAMNLLAGKGFWLAFHGLEGPTAAHAPFQAFVLALIHGLLGVGWLGVAAVVLVRALACAAMVLLAYRVARHLMRPELAVLACAVIACHPALVYCAATLGHLDNRLPLSLPLMLLAMWAWIVACEDPRAGRVLLAGLASGSAALSEPPMLLFTGVASLVSCSRPVRVASVSAF
jgi:4-amino-4-deoxy-L-arabinose transferase-like glycosyltransferase